MADSTQNDNHNHEIDNTSGFIFEKKIGDEVKMGDVLAYVHANDENKAISAVLKDSPNATLEEIIKLTLKRL